MRLTKTAIFMIFCCGVIAACGLILMESLPKLLEEPPVPQRRGALVEPRIEEVEPLEPAEAEAEAEAEQAPAAAELAVLGRLVDAELRPLSGFEIVCDEAESAVTDASGRFAFPARSRPSPLAVTLRRGDREIARWDGVLDLASAAGAARPKTDRVRWSLSLCSETIFEAPLSGADRVATSAGSFAPGQYFSLGAVLVEEWGLSGAVHIEGRSRLPDGLHVYAAVYHWGDRLASGDPAEISSGLFDLTLRLPQDFRFFSGAYEIKVFFSTAQEDFRQMEAMQRQHEEIAWDQLSDYAFSRPIFVGSPEESEQYDRLALAHYRSGLEELLGLRKVYLHRRTETARSGGGWDPDLLRTRAASRESWVRDASSTADGDFDEEDWRRFLDVEWRPTVVEIVQRRLPGPGVKYPRATYHLETALRALHKFSYVDSVTLYAQLGKPPSELDRIQPGEIVAEDDRLLLLKMVDEHLDALRPHLERLAAAVSRDRSGGPKIR